jgi:hypothetical protein
MSGIATRASSLACVKAWRRSRYISSRSCPINAAPRHCLQPLPGPSSLSSRRYPCIKNKAERDPYTPTWTSRMRAWLPDASSLNTERCGRHSHKRQDPLRLRPCVHRTAHPHAHMHELWAGTASGHQGLLRNTQRSMQQRCLTPNEPPPLSRLEKLLSAASLRRPGAREGGVTAPPPPMARSASPGAEARLGSAANVAVPCPDTCVDTWLKP